MIDVIKGWESWRYGPCRVRVDSKGWFQRQTKNEVIELEVCCSQLRLNYMFPQLHREIMLAKIDTGAERTVISRKLFESNGFDLPSCNPSVLKFTGVVRGLNGNSSYCLFGWEDVALKIRLLDYLSNDGPKLPTCSVNVVVAENVSDAKFLLGLDFLRHLQLTIEHGFIVAVAS